MAYYNIKSRKELIDITTIANGCKIIEAASEKISKCAKHVEIAAEICDKNALCIENTTMQPQLEVDAAYIRKIKEDILEFTATLMSVSASVYSAMETELIDRES